ncbi:restriction endonuclease subunit S [Betaproteobacteria bacterium PRO5]|nr:restriction endonuclease subunit S [Betaproteobacteria bacterium PRO5]
MKIDVLSTVVAALESGKRPKGGASKDSGTIPSLGGEHLNNDGGFRFDNLKYINEQFFAGLKKGAIRTNDILIVKDGATTGKVSYVGSNFPFERAAINEHLFALTVNAKVAHPRYVFSFLKSPQGQKEILKDFRGAAIGGISRGFVDLAKIPLPSLQDQIRIAHLLGKVEGRIAQRKQHLQHLDNLLKSVFLEMFGPQSAGYADWPLDEIKDLAARHKGAMRTGPFGSNLLHSEFSLEGDVAVLGIDNAVQNRFAWGESRYITHEKYKELESYRVFPGDVIVTIMGTIGRSAVVPNDIPLAINTKHLAAITLNRELANPTFLSYSIHSSPFILNQFRSKNRGAIMSGLNLGLIKETKLKRPPIGLQNEFSEIHARIDELKDTYKQSLIELENLYGALSQKAFEGELDLSRVPIPVEYAS